MNNEDLIRSSIQGSIDVKQKIVQDDALVNTLNTVASAMVESLKQGGKVLFCGNGGSAADAQHLAAELSGRFYKDREPLYAEALHVNSSYLTAVANDYSYDEVYSRMLRAMGRKNDVLVGISTSGNSGNVVRAVETANQLGMMTVGMTGEAGGQMNDLCQHLLRVPSTDTPRIQESHILMGHILCLLVEEQYFDSAS